MPEQPLDEEIIIYMNIQRPLFRSFAYGRERGAEEICEKLPHLFVSSVAEVT